MYLFRKFSLFFIILAFISKILLASNYNFESNANGIFEIQSIMLIDEMPAQFNGKVNTSGDVDYNGEKLKSVTSCLYSVIIKEGVAVYRGTCRDYFDEENILYTSIVSEYNFPANGAESVVTVLGGEGIFEDATGEGTNNWNSVGITDPNNSNIGYLKVSTNLRVITE